MRSIDLRSDTVTTPTPAMRQAMAAAEVGDDVYGEDPTVQRLEALAAERLGKEAALFLASGTQANQVAILSHTGRGDEVIVEADAHIFFYEVAGLAALSACQARTIPSAQGEMDLDQVEAAIRGENVHFPRTAVVCVENTHNRHGGTVLSQAYLQALGDMAHRRGVAVHMDGARIFNAAVASGCSAAAIAASADSVMFCLSKGLSAPVGSLLCGSTDFIARARRYRKLLGGGMRQVGVLAAPGMIALTEMVDRLAADHAHARTLALGLSQIDGLAVPLDRVQTNIVACEVTAKRWDAANLVAALAGAGVKVNAMGPRRIRLVTHKDVTAADIAAALSCIETVMKSGSAGEQRATVYG